MDKLISKFRKNTLEEIQVRVHEYQGRELVDIRIYAGPRGQETTPTKKGVSIPVELFGELRDAIEMVQDVLEDEGLY